MLIERHFDAAHVLIALLSGRAELEAWADVHDVEGCGGSRRLSAAPAPRALAELTSTAATTGASPGCPYTMSVARGQTT